MAGAIVDTGPLVAFLDRAERHHEWVVGRIAELQAPLLLCEPVLAEAMYLLAGRAKAQDLLFDWIESGALSIAFAFASHVSELRALHRKYRDRPMSLADACIVRMSELYERHAVLTLDADFLIYRKHGRIPLDVIYPPTR